jgi:tetratricopeptide (TPR) repeat protein
MQKLLVPVLAMLLFNCTSYHYWEGKNLLQDKKYNDAIIKFLLAEKKAPDDYKIKRDIGIALFEQKNYPLAFKKLQAANELHPDDNLIHFYLGRIYEALDRYDEALNEYTRCKKSKIFNQIAPLLEIRIQEIFRKKIAHEVKKAVDDERNLQFSMIPDNTMAVLYFKNLDNWERLTPLEKGLAQMLITDLSKVRVLKMLERLRLEELIQELNLSDSDLFTSEQTPRLGKLLGSHKLVKGGFKSNEEGEVQIIAAVVESESGSVINREIVLKGGIFNFFDLEKKLVFKIIETLGINLSYSEIEAIKEVPTQSLLAYLAYSKGIDFEDQGLFQDANLSFLEAVKIDPDFAEAQSRVALFKNKTVTDHQLTAMMIKITERTSLNRLENTGQNLVKHSLPIDADNPSASRPASTGTVLIKGTLPAVDVNQR